MGKLSTDPEILRCILSLWIILIIFFSIYQYIIGEWTTATLWMVASVMLIGALFADIEGTVLGALVAYSVLAFIIFIVHICFLALINTHLSQSYPDQSMIVADITRAALRRMLVTTQIVGITFSILISIFVIPTLFLLSESVGHDKNKKRSFNHNDSTSGTTYDRSTMDHSQHTKKKNNTSDDIVQPI